MAVYLVEKKMVKSVEEGLLLISEEDVTTASLLRVKHATKRWSDVIAVDEWKKERAKRSAAAATDRGGGRGGGRRGARTTTTTRKKRQVRNRTDLFHRSRRARNARERQRGWFASGESDFLCCECVDSSLLKTDEERRFAEDEESVVDVLQDLAGVIFLKDDRFGAELSKKEFGIACVSGANDDDSGGFFSIEIDKKSRKFAKFTTTTTTTTTTTFRSNTNNNNSNDSNINNINDTEKRSTTILHTGDYVTIDGRNGYCLSRQRSNSCAVKSERNKLFFEWLAQKSKFLNAIRIFAECDSADAIDEYVEENNNRDGTSVSGGDTSNFIGPVW